MKLWKKHLFSHLLKTFFSSFILLICIYLVIERSIEHPSFSQNVSFFSLLFSYGGKISQFLDLFLITSFLFSILKVIIDLNDHREFLVLQLAGISSFQLAVPFLQCAFFLQIISYANQEWIYPFLISENKVVKPQEDPLLFSQNLSDGSVIVYRNYDFEKEMVIDLFWLKEESTLLHFETIDLSNDVPKALYAQKLEKKEEGLILKESLDFLFLDPSLFSKKLFQKGFEPLEERKMSTLFKESSQSIASRAHFHYKLALGALPYLLFLVQTPFFLSYSRSRNRLLPISISLLTLILTRTAIDAGLIMTENHLFSPLLGIWGPTLLPIFFLSFFFFFRYILRYGKKRSQKGLQGSLPTF